jgi:pyruvate dehydrogenase (quinone)
VAIVGDGGFAMLMAEMSTAVKNQLPIKIFLLRNDALAEVLFEQRDLGNPAYGCELGGIDYAQVATACGAQGFHCAASGEIVQAVQATLSSAGPALLEARVDAEEPPSMPHQLKV